MRKLGSALVGAMLMAAALTVVSAGPVQGAVGDGHPRLKIDVVVNGGGGLPTGTLQVHRECNPAGNATSADSDPFTTSTADLMPGTASFLSSGQSCVVSVIAVGGMIASFGCATTDAALITCGSDHTVTWVADQPEVDATQRTATVTVTFDQPPPTSTTTTPAVEVEPTFTG